MDTNTRGQPISMDIRKVFNQYLNMHRYLVIYSMDIRFQCVDTSILSYSLTTSC